MAKARQQYFADETSIAKDSREFGITPELLEKIDSIEPWAQVNVIETVKVNWDALTPDEDKAVDISVPLVDDTLYSTSSEDALSARQWRILYDYIQNLQSRWRFLSNWNCATWLAMTNPIDNPYNYRTWDYYLVSNVAALGWTNYCPDGAQYIINQASTTVETDVVKVWDMYIYDWTNWLLLVNTEREIAIDSSLSTTSTNPVENRVITNALNWKQDTISDLATIRSWAALWATSLQPGDSLSQLTWTADDIAEWSTNLFMTTSERSKLSNQSWVNTWDETQTTIKNKLWQASTSTDGYLTSTDWNTFNWKQDAISDLATIRSNASAGKSASDTIATYWDIVTHNVNEFATAAQWALADTALQNWDNVSELVNDAWYITAAYHDSTKQDVLIAGNNIQIASDWVTISATDTTYVASDFDIKDLSDTTWLRTTWSWKQDELIAWTNIQIAADWKTISATDTTYSAWVNVSISNNNVISATDNKAEWWNITWTLSDQTDLNTALGWKQDTLIAWTNVQIASDGKTISATDTTYTAGTWISIDANNVISNTQTSAEWWNITGTLSDQTDLQNVLNAKQDNLTAWDNISISNNTISADVNTKTFPMAFATKVADAQAAIDWVLGWNNALIEYDNRIYLLDKIDNWVYYFRGINYTHNTTNDTMVITNIEVTVVSGTVTEVHIMWENHWFLETNRTYSNPFIPTQDWHPVTKKYVDDSISTAVGWAVDDTAYAASWDWVTAVAPSKNAVYDKISSMDTTIWGKQDTLIAWTNIQIAADWKTISATDTTYTASDFDIKDLADTTNLRTTWSWKQDTISDLATIRTWAGKGATAVQPLDNVSTLTNNWDWTNPFITKAVSDLTNYYTKSETYTKSEVADLVANFAGFQVVATLPITDIKTNIIYLLWPVWSWADKYEEYIYSNNNWILIWDTSIDLSPYFHKRNDDSDDIIEWSINLFLTSAERTILSNTSNTNSWDETKTTIQTKLWAASSSNDWYLTSTDWSTFNSKLSSSAISDTAYWSWWNADTTHAPSKNAVYDKISAMDTTIAWKQNALSTQTAYTAKWTATKVPQITTNTLWQVTEITEVDIQTWETYNAWKWIEIWNDYSAMQWPAPDGFHVPLNTERQAVRDIRTALGGWSSDWTNFWIALKLPFAGYRYYSSAGVSSQGSDGYYWSSSRYNTNTAYSLRFYSTALNPQDAGNRANGFSVRCFRNSPIIPTSSWTKLYWTSIEAGWIFWSSSEWLISLSSDWQTWITIADKNLWATTVRNSWDTLSETNCWKYYQRWNNYWFPRTWTIANQSTTQVDASSYWPWNYYSSDTFIKYSGRWDTTDNWNLWWWVTWVVSNAITNTGVLSVNGQTGYVTVNEPTVSATAPSNPSQWDQWYDTTNNELNIYDGLTWNAVWGWGWDVVVSPDTGNELSTWVGLWLWTESDYSSITTPDSNTMYIQYVVS